MQTILPDTIEIRHLNDADNMESLTRLIQDAHIPHLNRGLKYRMAHQTVEDTRERYNKGQGFVALINGEYVGTLLLRSFDPDSSIPLYQNDKVRILSQFCVHPEFQGKGISKKMHDFAENFAMSTGTETMALDTSDQATNLISLYKSWGYEIVGQCDWRPITNYTSVIMKKDLVYKRE